MNKENDMTLMTTPESQQKILKNRLSIAEIRLTNCLLFPESRAIVHKVLTGEVVNRFDPNDEAYLLNRRQADYDEAYAAYNDFLDDRIQDVIIKRGVLN